MNTTSNTFKPLTYVLLLCVVFTLNSCKKEEKKEILSDKISHIDFINNLEIEGVVESVKNSTISYPRGPLSKIIWIIKDGTIVKDSDVVCILECEELQKDYDESLIQLDIIKGSRNKAEADLNMQYAMLDAQVKSNAAQTAISNLDTLQLKYLSPKKRRIKELELQKSAIEKAKLERKLKNLDIINQSQLRNLDIQIQSWAFRVANAKEQLDKLTLRSLQSGTAFRKNSYFSNEKIQEGDQVYGGMPLINIPDYSEMKVIISASESNYKQINVNDSVEYSFDALPGLKAKGKILMKAPVGQPIKEKSKVKIFQIEASMDKAPKLPDPGLSAHCNIIMNRVRDTIVVPQIAIFEEDSMKVVYVKTNNNYERRQVNIGTTSLNNAVITAGLKGYERLSLIKPSNSRIKKTTLLPKPKKKQIAGKKIKIPGNNKATAKTLKTQSK